MKFFNLFTFFLLRFLMCPTALLAQSELPVDKDEIEIVGARPIAPTNKVSLKKAEELVELRKALDSRSLLILRAQEPRNLTYSSEYRDGIVKGYVVDAGFAKEIPELTCYKNPVMTWIVQNGRQTLIDGNRNFTPDGQNFTAILGFYAGNIDRKNSAPKVIGNIFVYLDALIMKGGRLISYEVENKQIPELYDINNIGTSFTLSVIQRDNTICLAGDSEVPNNLASIVSGGRGQNVIWARPASDNQYQELSSAFIKYDPDIVKINKAVMRVTLQDTSPGNIYSADAALARTVSTLYSNIRGRDVWLGCSVAKKTNSSQGDMSCGRDSAQRISNFRDSAGEMIFDGYYDKYIMVKVSSKPDGAAVFVSEERQPTMTDSMIGTFGINLDKFRFVKKGFAPCFGKDIDGDWIDKKNSTYRISCKLHESGRRRRIKLPF